MRALGISRSEAYSPNLVEKDARILHAVGEQLHLQGAEVSYLSEDELSTSSLGGVDVVFSMGRHPETLEILQQAENEGVLVVNPAQGVRNAERYQLCERLMETHPEAFPTTVLLPDIPAHAEGWPYPCWLKRADACAQVKADVQFIATEQEAETALQDFKTRGIRKAVVNAHLTGDLVKFYGVAGTDFFFWSYPDIHKTKFGLEEKNGEAAGYSFDEQQMKAVCDAAALSLSLPVYGGDCVVDPQGNFKIIDFNDWPSFSACCEAAGKAIANHIQTRYEHK